MYCIFDGHSGHTAAELAASKFADILWEEMTEIADLEDHLLPESVFPFISSKFEHSLNLFSLMQCWIL